MIIQVNVRIFQHHLLKTFPYLTEFPLLQINWPQSVQFYFGTLFFFHSAIYLVLYQYHAASINLALLWEAVRGSPLVLVVRIIFAVLLTSLQFFFFYSSCQFLPKSFWSNIRKMAEQEVLGIISLHRKPSNYPQIRTPL